MLKNVSPAPYLRRSAVVNSTPLNNRFKTVEPLDSPIEVPRALQNNTSRFKRFIDQTCETSTILSGNLESFNSNSSRPVRNKRPPVKFGFEELSWSHNTLDAEKNTNRSRNVSKEKSKSKVFTEKDQSRLKKATEKFRSDKTLPKPANTKTEQKMSKSKATENVGEKRDDTSKSTKILASAKTHPAKHVNSFRKEITASITKPVDCEKTNNVNMNAKMSHSQRDARCKNVDGNVRSDAGRTKTSDSAERQSKRCADGLTTDNVQLNGFDTDPDVHSKGKVIHGGEKEITERHQVRRIVGETVPQTNGSKVGCNGYDFARNTLQENIIADKPSSRDSCSSTDSQMTCKPSFIKRKLYSMNTEFGETESTASNTSFLDKNRISNIYNVKANGNKRSLSSVNRKTSCSSAADLRVYTLRKTNKEKNYKSCYAGDSGAEDLQIVTTTKETAFKFINNMLKDVQPIKVVPEVAESIEEKQEERLDIFDCDEQCDVASKTSKRQADKSDKKVKEAKKKEPKPKKEKEAKPVKKKEAKLKPEKKKEPSPKPKKNKDSQLKPEKNKETKSKPKKIREAKLKPEKNKETKSKPEKNKEAKLKPENIREAKLKPEKKKPAKVNENERTRSEERNENVKEKKSNVDKGSHKKLRKESVTKKKSEFRKEISSHDDSSSFTENSRRNGSNGNVSKEVRKPMVKRKNIQDIFKEITQNKKRKAELTEAERQTGDVSLTISDSYQHVHGDKRINVVKNTREFVDIFNGKKAKITAERKISQCRRMEKSHTSLWSDIVENEQAHYVRPRSGQCSYADRGSSDKEDVVQWRKPNLLSHRDAMRSREFSASIGNRGVPEKLVFKDGTFSDKLSMLHSSKSQLLPRNDTMLRETDRSIRPKFDWSSCRPVPEKYEFGFFKPPPSRLPFDTSRCLSKGNAFSIQHLHSAKRLRSVLRPESIINMSPELRTWNKNVYSDMTQDFIKCNNVLSDSNRQQSKIDGRNFPLDSRYHNGSVSKRFGDSYMGGPSSSLCARDEVLPSYSRGSFCVPNHKSVLSSYTRTATMCSTIQNHRKPDYGSNVGNMTGNANVSEWRFGRREETSGGVFKVPLARKRQFEEINEIHTHMKSKVPKIDDSVSNFSSISSLSTIPRQRQALGRYPLVNSTLRDSSVCSYRKRSALTTPALRIPSTSLHTQILNSNKQAVANNYSESLVSNTYMYVKDAKKQVNNKRVCSPIKPAPTLGIKSSANGTLLGNQTGTSWRDENTFVVKKFKPVLPLPKTMVVETFEQSNDFDFVTVSKENVASCTTVEDNREEGNKAEYDRSIANCSPWRFRAMARKY